MIMQYLVFVRDNLLLLGCTLSAAIVVVRLLVLLRQVERWKHLARHKWVTLELVPPRNNAKSAAATQQLFSVLHGLNAARRTREKALGRKAILVPGFVSTRGEGIRFFAKIPEAAHDVFRQGMASFMLDGQINKIAGIPAFAAEKQKVVEFKLTGPFAYPLRDQDAFNESDPIAYIIGVMSKLAAEEGVSFQLVLSPVKPRAAKVIRNKQDPLEYVNRSAVWGIFGFALSVIGWFLELGASAFESSPPSSTPRTQPSVNPVKQELIKRIQAKMHEPLFEVTIRVLVASKDAEALSKRVDGIKTSLASYDTPEQELRARINWPVLQQLRRFAFDRQLPALSSKKACILSASEVASIYHFPYTATAQPENLHKSLSRTLPAPPSLKRSTKFDVVVGENVHQGSVTPIGMTGRQRARHMYIIGATGVGKTTLQEYMIMQDIENGKGVAVVDPHGDTARKIIERIPEERKGDVIYFNPDDIDHPPGLNIMEMDPTVTGSDRLRLKDRTVDVVVETLRKVFSDDGTGGHRIEDVLRNGILTAMTVEDATIFTILKLLRNETYRNTVVAKLPNGHLKDYWQGEAGKAGAMQWVKMSQGVTTKLNRFQSSEEAKRILGQPKSTINFDEILDGKILICNLAKGLISPDTSRLFGTIILSQIQLAAERRIRRKTTDRKPFYLYVDEFQNFATLPFTEMLAEARKYGLSVIMAEQSTSQQDDPRLIGNILANAATVVCFWTGNPADEQKLLPGFRTVIEPGEIMHLPAYNFYIRLAPTEQPMEPFSGRTIVLPEDGSEEVADRVIEASREQYTGQYVDPDETEPPDTDEPEEKVERPRRSK